MLISSNVKREPHKICGNGTTATGSLEMVLGVSPQPSSSFLTVNDVNLPNAALWPCQKMSE